MTRQTNERRRELYAANPLRRAKALETAVRWRRHNIDRFALNQRRQYYKQAHGLTLEQVADLLASQGGVCKICHTTTPGKAGWRVDHDHVTLEIRGVLCNKCNTGLGFFKDDAELLRAALKYLLPSR